MSYFDQVESYDDGSVNNDERRACVAEESDDNTSDHSSSSRSPPPSKGRKRCGSLVYDVDGDESQAAATPKRERKGRRAPSRHRRRIKPGGKADCEGRSVPDGYLYHVVGAKEQAPNLPVRLIVKPGAPPCWTPMNVDFFVGRHVAKLLPNVVQYACAKKEYNVKAPKQSDRMIKTRAATTSSYVWPAYGIDFDGTACRTAAAPAAASAAGGNDRAPLLSELYTSIVVFGNAHMTKIANCLRSDSTDFPTRSSDPQSTNEVVPEVFIGGGERDAGAGVPLDLERGIASPLLLTTHCLILDRDLTRDPGPAKLIDSIPPVMRQDGLPDAATLTRWFDLTHQRCQAFNEPLLAWCASSIQFGDGARAKLKSLWDIIMFQVTANKNRGRSFHDTWIETAFKIASIPFVAFLLKRRGISLPDKQLPLADMPVWSRAFEKPLVALEPLAPKSLFNISAVLAATMTLVELSSTDRLQDRAICEQLLQVSSMLASAVFCNADQLKRELLFRHIMRIEVASMLPSNPGYELLKHMCKPGETWDPTVNSQAASFELWANELQTKHVKMPRPVDVLKCVTRFAGDSRRLMTASAGVLHLQDEIGKLVSPGVISASSQPHRALIVVGVALRQLCFAYNMLPPVELPNRMLLRSDRSPLPVVAPSREQQPLFPLVLGHDALRPLAEPGVLGLPSRLVQFERVVAETEGSCELEPHVTVVPGAVWEQPSHAPRVLELIRVAAAGCESRLLVLLGGHECPLGFVRTLVACGGGHRSARLELPDDMDCCGEPIEVPAGVWCAYPVAVASFANTAVIYSLKPADRVLVVNALQVLPCVLDHLVAPGRVAHCYLALGAQPPDPVRFACLTKLTAVLMARATAASAGAQSTEAAPAKHQQRCLGAEGIPCNAEFMEQLGGTLFSRSAARLDCAGYTSFAAPESAPAVAAATGEPAAAVVYSSPRLNVAGLLGLSCKLADLLFLPRVVHPCARHQCVVLVDLLMDRPTVQWIDTAWGNIRCVFTQVAQSTTFADQSITGPTFQRPWMQCFVEDSSKPPPAAAATTKQR